MSLIEEIKTIAKEKSNQEELVIQEIVGWFEERINNKKYEDFLKEIITKKIEKGEENINLYIEYFNFSGTRYLYCGGYEFNFEDNTYYYKGIDITKISLKVVNVLTNILKERVLELGFSILEEKDIYKDKKRYIKIGW